MKKNGLLIIALVFTFTSTYAQQSISKANEKMIKAAALQTAEKYSSYLELMAEETDKDAIKILKAELLKYVDRDSIFVFNDLIPKEDRHISQRDNIDPLLTYLDDISSRYIDGVSIKYENFKNNNIYIDEQRHRLFTKVIADRALQGGYTYKNEVKQVENTEQMDFYISVSLNESGLPECKIYSALQHENNVGDFKEIKVVEKTAPIVFMEINEKNTLKRKSQHTIRWEGGELYERLSIDIFRKGESGGELLFSVDSSVVNDNTYSFFLTKKIKPGKKNPYYFQIKKLSSEEEPIKSEVFFVKRRTPLSVKIAAPIIIAAGVYYYIEKSKPTPETPADEVPGLPIDTN